MEQDIIVVEEGQKIRAGLVTGRGGRRFVVIGSNVYWDPAIFGIRASDVIPQSMHFVVHDSVAFFPVHDITAHITSEDVVIDEIEANLIARVNDA